MKRAASSIVTAILALTASIVVPSTTYSQPAPQRNPLATPRDGLTVNKPNAFPGYSLVAPMNSTSTYLIDMEARIVNEWKSEFRPALSAYLLENGHLLRPGSERGSGFGGPGSGGRIQEMDWNGNLVWDYSFGDGKLRPHHDICRLPNGNILVIAADTKTTDEAIAAGRRAESLRGQLTSECILEIKPTGPTTGEIVWKWFVWDHLIQDFDKAKPWFGDVSEHPELIDLNFSGNMMDRMMNDPQQLARLRSLGYVGGPTTRPGADVAGNKPADNRNPASENRGTPPASPAAGQDRKDTSEQPAAADDAPGAGAFRNRRVGARVPGRNMQGDWLHFNSVSYNARLDQIMISVHEFSEVWIIDHSTTTEEAAAHQGGRRGKGGDLLYRWGNPRVYRSGSNADQRLFAQHCAHWIDDGYRGAGHMLVFNNGNGRPDGDFSTVDEVVLPLNDKGLYDKDDYIAFQPERATWSFSASDKMTFASMLISGAQRLPNGNTFICSGNQGILFEVAPDKEIVWQFKYPGAGFGGQPPRPGDLVPEVFRSVLALATQQKKSIDDLQSDVDAKLAKLLTDEQLRKFRRPPPPIPFQQFSPRFNPGPRRLTGPPGQDQPPTDLRDDPPPPGSERPGARMPRVGDVIPENLIEELELSESQQGELKRIQDRVRDELAKTWTVEQKRRLDDLEKTPSMLPGFRPPPRFGPPGPPFSPPGDGPPDGPPGGPPGRPAGNPGGIFRSYRYGADYPGLVGRNLTPGKKLDELAIEANRQPGERPDADNSDIKN